MHVQQCKSGHAQHVKPGPHCGVVAATLPTHPSIRKQPSFAPTRIEAVVEDVLPILQLPPQAAPLPAAVEAERVHLALHLRLEGGRQKHVARWTRERSNAK